MTNLFKVLFVGSFLLIGNASFAQDDEKGPEVSQAQGEKSTKPATKFHEVVISDSTSVSELMKRAVSWVKVESPRFKKTKGVTTGSKAEFVAVFKIKPKELNPQPDFTGTISMHVSIECKDNRYKYVITKLKHTSTNGKASGGDIDNLVPECGSMTMPDLVWKKIKGDAIKNSTMVISELKEGMQLSSEFSSGKDEW